MSDDMEGWDLEMTMTIRNKNRLIDGLVKYRGQLLDSFIAHGGRSDIGTFRIKLPKGAQPNFSHFTGLTVSNSPKPNLPSIRLGQTKNER